MTKKKTVVGDMIQGIQKAASRIGKAASKAADVDAPGKLHERIVPVPQIDTYSELPFALVEKAGETTTKPKKTTVKSPKKQVATAKAKKAVKKSAKRRSSHAK